MQDYEKPFLIKKKKSKKLKIFFWIFFCFGFFALVVFSLCPILKLAKKQQLEKSFFVVMLDTKNVGKNEVSEEAQALKTRGGAGVLFFKSTFFVAISVYESESDAKKIAKNLCTESQTFVVKKFEIVLKKSEQNTNFFNFLILLLNGLYDISLKLEKGELTPVLANLELRNHLTQTSVFFENARQNNNLFFEKVFLNAKSVLEYATSIDILSTSLLPYQSVVRAAEIEILSKAFSSDFSK